LKVLTPGHHDRNQCNVEYSAVDRLATAWCVVQVWAAGYLGFANAYASSLGGSCGAGPPFKVVLGGVGSPPSPPAPLLGLTPFDVGLYMFDHPTPKLDSRLSGTNNLSFTWATTWALAWRYVLQQSPDLKPTHWVTVSVTSGPDFDGSAMRVTIPKPNGTMFYRLMLQVR